MESILSVDLVRELDKAPPTPRYWATISVLAIVNFIDYFDFFIAGFIVAVVGPLWKLTYAQAALVLMAAGFGSIAGALSWGWLSDRYGRKLALMSAMVICGISAGCIGLLADGDWITFSCLRFLVGFGLAGAATAGLSLTVEHSPLRQRTIVSGLSLISATVGIFIASFTAATLLAALGWRGVAMLGVAAVIGVVPVALIVPESVKWLLSVGDTARARVAAQTMLRRPVPEITVEREFRQRASFSDLLVNKRGLTVIVATWVAAAMVNTGVYAWGPTIVAMRMNIAVKDAGKVFVVVSLVGILGKVIFSILPHFIGRRRAGQLNGAGMAVMLAGAAFSGSAEILGVPVFVIMLALGAVFFDGVFSNVAPYSAELFPVKLAARAVGVGQASNGLGKILGPLLLALVAGANNFISPQATNSAIFPAFMMFALCGVALLVAFTLATTETHGRSMVLSVTPPVGWNAAVPGRDRTQGVRSTQSVPNPPEKEMLR